MNNTRKSAWPLAKIEVGWRQWLGEKPKTGEVVASKHLRLAVETEEERRARVEKMVATAQLVLALIKGVVDVGVNLFL